MRYRSFFRCAVVIGAGLALVMAGCSSKDSRRRKPRTRKGVIKHIDLDKKYARVEVHDRSGQKQIEMDGRFTDETVVTINGAAARIQDVRAGDAAEVTVTISGKGLDAEFTATRVEVIRPGSTTASAPSG